MQGHAVRTPSHDATPARPAPQLEVDLLLAHGRRILPVEVKLGAALGARDVAGLRSCMTDLNLRRAVVVYAGDEHRSMGGGIQLIPWSSVAEGDFDLL